MHKFTKTCVCGVCEGDSLSSHTSVVVLSIGTKRSTDLLMLDNYNFSTSKKPWTSHCIWEDFTCPFYTKKKTTTTKKNKSKDRWDRETSSLNFPNLILHLPSPWPRGSMHPPEVFCDARRTMSRIVLKFYIAYGASFAQLLVKKLTRGQFHQRKTDGCNYFLVN